eukprot:5401076-Alexandrium_andersonii.AAC.1
MHGLEDGGADLTAVRRSLRRAGPRRAALMRLVVEGGVWTPRRRAEAGFRLDPACPLCGAACCDLEHLFGECQG